MFDISGHNNSANVAVKILPDLDVIFTPPEIRQPGGSPEVCNKYRRSRRNHSGNEQNLRVHNVSTSSGLKLHSLDIQLYGYIRVKPRKKYDACVT